MTYRKRLQFLLVQRLRVSYKQALELILSGKVYVNGVSNTANSVLSETDEVVFEDKVLKEGKTLMYVAYYKPRGIETTLNTEIPDNLKSILPFEQSLTPVGRLDKESEGLLLLSNDGPFFDKMLKQENKVEKEYIVTVNKIIDDHFIDAMSNGITIMGRKTLACQVERIDDFTFRIILIQGLNRQIRRMCYKLHYDVVNLVRVRIGDILLDGLSAREYRILKY